MEAQYAINSANTHTSSWDKFNSCLSPSTDIAYFQRWGKTFAVEILNRKSTAEEEKITLTELSFSDANGLGFAPQRTDIPVYNRRLSSRVKGNPDGPIPIIIRVTMQNSNDIDSEEKFGVSLKVKGKQMNLANSSKKILGSWKATDLFGSKRGNRKHKAYTCTIKTIYVGGEDRQLTIARDEIADELTGNSDESKHGDSGEMELTLHIEGGAMKPPSQVGLEGKWWNESSSSEDGEEKRESSEWGPRGLPEDWAERELARLQPGPTICGSSIAFRGGDRAGSSHAGGRSDEMCSRRGTSQYRKKSKSLKKSRTSHNLESCRVIAGEREERQWQTVSFKETAKVTIPLDIRIDGSSYKDIY